MASFPHDSIRTTIQPYALTLADLELLRKLGGPEAVGPQEDVERAIEHDSELIRIQALRWIEYRKATADLRQKRARGLLTIARKAYEEAAARGEIWNPLIDEVAYGDEDRRHSLYSPEEQDLESLMKEQIAKVASWVKEEASTAAIDMVLEFRSERLKRAIAASARKLSPSQWRSLASSAQGELALRSDVSAGERGAMMERCWKNLLKEMPECSTIYHMVQSAPSQALLTVATSKEGLPRNLRSQMRGVVETIKSQTQRDAILNILVSDRNVSAKELAWAAERGQFSTFAALLENPLTPLEVFENLDSSGIRNLKAGSQSLLSQKGPMVEMTPEKLEIALRYSFPEGAYIGRGLRNPAATPELRARVIAGFDRESKGEQKRKSGGGTRSGGQDGGDLHLKKSALLRELLVTGEFMQEPAVVEALVAQADVDLLQMALQHPMHDDALVRILEALVKVSPTKALEMMEKGSVRLGGAEMRAVISPLLASADSEIRLRTIAAIGRSGDSALKSQNRVSLARRRG